jgi:hypothetical protein
MFKKIRLKAKRNINRQWKSKSRPTESLKIGKLQLSKTVKDRMLKIKALMIC